MEVNQPTPSGGAKQHAKPALAATDGRIIVRDGLSRDGLTQALDAMQVSVRYCVRASRAHVNLPGAAWAGDREPGWQPLDDRLEEALKAEIAVRFCYVTRDDKVSPLRFGRDRWHTAFNAMLATREVDSFIDDWLDTMPEWDGIGRLELWLRDLFGAGEGEDESVVRLVRWAGRFMFLGPVQLAACPGADLPQIPVLIGAQGWGKSAVLRHALPVDRFEWFNDAINLCGTTKEIAEALQGCVIVEASEMAGVSHADTERLKAVLTRRNDKARLAYRRNPEDMLRRAIIVGTTNDAEPLPNDPSGNRRFVPITLKRGANVEEYMNENREQLWAEARALYDIGITAELPRKDFAAARIVAEDARKKDEILEDRVGRVAETISDGEGLTLEEIARRMNFQGEVDKRTEYRIAEALKLLGLVKRRVSVTGEAKRPMMWMKAS